MPSAVAPRKLAEFIRCELRTIATEQLFRIATRIKDTIQAVVFSVVVVVSYFIFVHFK